MRCGASTRRSRVFSMSTAAATRRAWMAQRTRSGDGRDGFTLIEILIVVSIIGILVSIAVPIYQKAILRTRESVLRNNLFTIRTVLDEYTYDKQKAPQTLQDLVTEG